MTYSPTLLAERPRSEQVLVAGLIPAVIGGVAGVLIGVSSGGYWVLAALAAIGALVAGFEHPDGRSGFTRGLAGGLMYGVTLLVVHALAGTHARVSLGGFPPLLIVVTGVVGAGLGAVGGRLAPGLRQRAADR